jgi:hypothetical protein
MPSNYQQQVIDEYARKRDAGSLSLNLMQPTRSGLREECLNVYKEKGSPQVDPVLRLFFGPIAMEDNYVQRIRNFDVDKFRPLVNFLKDQTITTQDKNIALLAWLIGFPTASSGVKDANVISGNAPKVEKRNFLMSANPVAEPGNLIQAFTPKYQLFDKRVMIAIFTVIVVVLIGSFSRENNQCMYWTGTQYQSIPCNEKAGNAMIIALDTFKVSNLKKITRPDTLTESALGKVWYRKIKRDSIEFYTGAGEHPLDNKKRLMPLTEYILNKYVLQK